MDTPISSEMIVLYGNPHDPMIIEAAKKLEDQGRYVEIHPYKSYHFIPVDRNIKSESEIQRAHDVLAALLNGEIDIPTTSQTIHSAHCALNVLAWVLNKDDQNKFFRSTLDEIVRDAERRGFVITKTA